MHGGVVKEELNKENLKAVEAGLANLGRHIRNVAHFGVPVVVAVNNFTSDTDEEFQIVKNYCADLGVEAILCKHWENGSSGINSLAKKVVELSESGTNQFRPLYEDSVSLWEKVNVIAKTIYGASEVVADKSIRDQFKNYQESGYGNFPICMAKTQYSFSTDPNLKGAPSDHVLPIREIRLSTGAEFIVVVAGEIMTMPGLSRNPSANLIKLDISGNIEGLF
jgi:formate--tetrahydrofolate ligase